MHWHAMFKTAAFKEYFRAAESMHIKRSLPTTEQGVIGKFVLTMTACCPSRMCQRCRIQRKRG